MKKYWVFGNWKSIGCKQRLEAFSHTFLERMPTLPEALGTGIALPYHLIEQGRLLAPHWAGAQNVSSSQEGAYTGEIHTGMLNDMGTSFCLVGHSERRQYYAETVLDTETKLARLYDANIYPVFCIGETLEQREAGALETVLRQQLTPVDKCDEIALAVAYEPVWAIGTGVAATPADVAEAHSLIRSILGEFTADRVPILYGGSVKPNNAEALATIEDVAGFLVGGASLKPNSLADIVLKFRLGKNL